MKKALKVIGIVLLALLFVATFVLYVIFPTQTKDTLTNIWAFLNTPLPIVGITSIALFVFIWNVVVFIRKNQPLKELAELRKEHNEYKQESEKKNKNLKNNLLNTKAMLLRFVNYLLTKRLRNLERN